jgi:hypothetical protein
MKLQGLHYQISMKRLAASELARQARRVQCDPRTSYEKGVEAERLALEADGLADHLHGNEQMMEGILHQIHYLARSPHQSRYRSLCLTALEQAHSWLLRENGEPEPERKFEAVEAAAPKNGLKA